MIFITLGSQKFQFNRVLEEVDRLIQKKKIKEEVFAQIGNSDYIPKNFKYEHFLDREEFKKYISQCDIVITHGGTGAIMTAVKANKKVIAIPRLAEFNEHVNDHQVQIVKNFEKSDIILPVYKIEELADALNKISYKKFEKYVSNNEKIIKDLENYIDNI